MAGYSGTPLAKKLGIKEGFRVALIGSPGNFVEMLEPVPPQVKFIKRLSSSHNLILLFTKSATELEKKFSQCASKLASNGMLWVAWPKKASKIETDLNFDVVQKIGLATGLVDVKICAIDEIWSGLKFVIRVKDRH